MIFGLVYWHCFPLKKQYTKIYKLTILNCLTLYVLALWYHSEPPTSLPVPPPSEGGLRVCRVSVCRETRIWWRRCGAPASAAPRAPRPRCCPRREPGPRGRPPTLRPPQPPAPRAPNTKPHIQPPPSTAATNLIVHIQRFLSTRCCILRYYVKQVSCLDLCRYTCSHMKFIIR